MTARNIHILCDGGLGNRLSGLDTKQWQMGHVVRLRTAGMEDIQL